MAARVRITIISFLLQKQLLGVGKVVVTGNRLVSGWGSVLGKRDVIANKEDKSRARKMGILDVCTYSKTKAYLKQIHKLSHVHIPAAY